ncbi:MAG: DUF2510 domain-containing protein [Acidimicrobiales bacterium]
MAHLSGSELIALGALGVVWAAIGYYLSERSRRATGRTPWGLPSPVWALLWFLSVLLGLVLYLIAQYTATRKAGRMGPAPFVVQSSFPAYPYPANHGVSGSVARDASDLPTQDAARPAAVLGTRPPDGPELPAAFAPRGWYPDPSGRFHYRWWDGSMWTAQVSWSGQHLIDTHPDQQIGPY